jgi:protein-L-isoaspartate O-methyltransferase
MDNVPRHFFLDAAFEKVAYEDRAFQIGEGQTISHPYTVAYQTQLLDVKPFQKISCIYRETISLTVFLCKAIVLLKY